MASTIDVEARKRAAELMSKVFSKIVEEIEREERPVLVMPKRTLSNTIYDYKNKLLLLGPETLRRSFTDINEARKFMQTMLMASIIYDSLVNNEYPTIRDLYYRGKHSISYKSSTGKQVHENTWEEQKESDAVIRDLEVFLDVLREELLILSKEKGKVVGNLVIRSGDDTIDLSKMGHGAYSIEPTPDLIEFKDVDAEYVLVVEKDAVFQQLHRYGFWKKNKAILITSAGQPDRATRRFLRRLSDEYNLPVYILTDSIPRDEVVVIRDPVSKEVMAGPIEELIGRYFTGAERERVDLNIEVLAWSPETGRIRWMPIAYAYRHRIKDKILRIRTRGRGNIRVTKAHSLFVFRDGRIMVIPAGEIKPGDYILVAEHLPLPQASGAPREILVAKLLRSAALKHGDETRLLSTVKLVVNGERRKLGEASEKDLELATIIEYPRSKWKVENRVLVDEELAWLLGVFTAGGRRLSNRCLVFEVSREKHGIAEKVARVIEGRLGVKPRVVTAGNRVRVLAYSRILTMVFEEIGLVDEAGEKRVPSIILSSPRNVVSAYVKGLIDGGGSIDDYGSITYSTRSETLAKQVFLLLQLLGINPVLTESSEGITIRVEYDYSGVAGELYRYLTGREPGAGTGQPEESAYSIPVNNVLREELTGLAGSYIESSQLRDASIPKPRLRELVRAGLVNPPGDYHLIAEGDVVVARVESVEEEDYEGYVYDFAVPGDNSFIGGFGVVFHNSDPYGFYIYSVFKIGSITLSYESERLATPRAKFIGVMMTDVFGDSVFKNILKEKESKKLLDSIAKGVEKLRSKKPYLSEEERRNYIIKAKIRDLERAVELIGYSVVEACLDDPDLKSKLKKKEGLTGYPWFQTPEWVRELCIFFKTLSKLEIEAMASKGLKFLADQYIPEKISTGDWID